MEQFNSKNFNKLYFFMKKLDKNRIKMMTYNSESSSDASPGLPDVSICGTAACIAGWASSLFGDHEEYRNMAWTPGRFTPHDYYARRGAAYLGLTIQEALLVFLGDWKEIFADTPFWDKYSPEEGNYISAEGEEVLEFMRDYYQLRTGKTLDNEYVTA